MFTRRYSSLISSRILLILSLACFLAGMSSSSYGSGFQIFETNVTSIGNFGAAGAAGPFDASIGATNPAALTHIQNQQAVASGIAVFFDTQFKGSATWQGVVAPIPAPYVQSGTAQGGGGNFVPAFHYAAPITERFVVALNVISPFGLETDYGESAFTRYSATDSRLRTVDISPAFGAKINKYFSLGAGFDFQYTDVRFNSIVGIPGYITVPPWPPGTPATVFDTRSLNEGSDWSYGWHAGFLFEPTEKTRIGFHFRSQVRHHLTGKSELVEGPLAGSPNNPSDLSAGLNFPATTTLSIYQVFTDKLAMMATVNYTNWNVFQTITLNNPAGPLTSVSFSQNYHDTWRIAVGSDYKISKKWLIRCGIGYDQTPSNDTDRNLRLPDEDRFAIAFGARYQATDHVGLEVGYTHLFIKDSPINNSDLIPPGMISMSGTSKNNADLLGLEVIWDIT